MNSRLAARLVHAVERDHHRLADLRQFQREFEVAFQRGGVHHQQQHVGGGEASIRAGALRGARWPASGRPTAGISGRRACRPRACESRRWRAGRPAKSGRGPPRPGIPRRRDRCRRAVHDARRCSTRRGRFGFSRRAPGRSRRRADSGCRAAEGRRVGMYAGDETSEQAKSRTTYMITILIMLAIRQSCQWPHSRACLSAGALYRASARRADA